MAITREKKEKILKQITDTLKNAKSVVFVNFHGLTVPEINDLRSTLREQGVGYVVAKKRLIKKVLEGMKLDGEMPSLDGELALAYGDDLIAPAKNIADFQKKFKEAVVPLGGIMEMRYLSLDEVKSLAAIPGRDVLYGQFVTVINSPIQQTASVLNSIVSSFVIALDQIAQSK